MTLDELTALENESIRAFVQQAADDGYLKGKILDYGCGRQPYRDICQGVGQYVAWDRSDFPFSMAPENVGGPSGLLGGFNSMLCTQVIQYVPVDDLEDWLTSLLLILYPDSWLVLTGPTNWPCINDLSRLTVEGIAGLLESAGFSEAKIDYREPLFDMGGFQLPFGYGVVARA